jgi:LSD1 subclass zinc finger protein
MNIVRTTCPSCRTPLEFPRDFRHVICAACQSSFRVREYGGTISLDQLETFSLGPSAPGSQDIEAAAFVASRLAELDELISEGEAEVEAVRAKEQSGPLQVGCSFFGIFFALVLVITLFMLIARKYVGSVVFYCVLAATVIIGLVRVRKKARDRSEVAQLRSERERLEAGLSALHAERNRVRELEDRLRDSADPLDAGPDHTD